MSFGITVDCPELAPILATLADLPNAGTYKGVELSGFIRKEPGLAVRGISNEDILSWLHDPGERKFAEMTSGNMEAIAQAWVNEFETQAQRALDKAKREAARGVGSQLKRFGVRGRMLTKMVAQARDSVISFQTSEKWAMQAAGRSWKAAMGWYMSTVASNIKYQWAPGGLKPLNPTYKAWKLRNYGFTTIGKLTGQLLENLDEVMAARAIRLTK
jgi:hypothetical protein